MRSERPRGSKKLRLDQGCQGGPPVLLAPMPEPVPSSVPPPGAEPPAWYWRLAGAGLVVTGIAVAGYALLLAAGFLRSGLDAYGLGLVLFLVGGLAVALGNAWQHSDAEIRDDLAWGAKSGWFRPGGAEAAERPSRRLLAWVAFLLAAMFAAFPTVGPEIVGGLGLLLLRVSIHELGHLAAAWLAGMRVWGLEVGAGPLVFRGRFAGLALTWRLLPWSGFAIAHPDLRRSWRRQKFFFVLGGPLADFTLLAAMLGLVMWARDLGVTPELLSGPLVVVLWLAWTILSDGCTPRRVLLRDQAILSDGWWLLRLSRLAPAEERECRLGSVSWEVLTAQEAGQPERVPVILAEAAQAGLAGVELSHLEAWWHGARSDWPAAAGALRRALAQQPAAALRQELQTALWLVQCELGEYAEIDRDVRKATAAAQQEEEQVVEAQWRLLDRLACQAFLRPVPAGLAEARGWIELARSLAPPGNLSLAGTHGALLVEAGDEAEGIPLLERVYAESRSAHDRAISAYYLAIARRRLFPEADVQALVAEARANLRPMPDWLEQRLARIA